MAALKRKSLRSAETRQSSPSKRSKLSPNLTTRQRAIEQSRLDQERRRREAEQKRAAQIAREKAEYARKYRREMARRKRLGHVGPLLTSTTGDYQQATLELVTEFQRRFGEQTPIWFIGSLDDAAREAYGTNTKTNDRKMLAIYIHNEKSISANIFCSQILCSTEIVNFLSENCISWAFDVTEYENKHRIYAQIDKMFGSQMATQLRRMSDDDFPVLILANGKGPTNEATEIVKGDHSIDAVMTKLLHSLDISNTRKQEDIQTELEREQRENEISQQESAYEQSLRADRERIKKQQEEEERKRTEERKAREEEHNNLRKKEEMENKLPPEPPATDKDVCQLRFRFPDGRMAVRRFKTTEKLSVLFIYMGSEGFQESGFRLLRQFPRADLSVLKRSQTLKDLGLKQDNLVVEAQATEDSEDEESDDESMEE